MAKARAGSMFDAATPAPLPGRHHLFADVYSQAACVYSVLACQPQTWRWRNDVIADAGASYSEAHDGQRVATVGSLDRLLRGRELKRCPECRGEGKFTEQHEGWADEEPCGRCNGTGKIETGSELNAKLDGTGWLVLSAKGRVCLCRETERDNMLAQLEE